MMLEHIKECYDRMERVSKIIIKCGVAAFLLCAFAAVFVLLFGSRLFFDYDTASYWFEELIALGREILGATVVPALIFEILFTYIEKRKN